jgi:hypothetical protein
LNKFMAVPVADRFQAAVAANDFRFLAIEGDAPGARRQSQPIEERTLPVPGATHARVSLEYVELVKQAEQYAREYNEMMVRYIQQAGR